MSTLLLMGSCLDNVKTLQLCDNQDIGEVGAKVVAAALSNGELKQLLRLTMAPAHKHVPELVEACKGRGVELTFLESEATSQRKWAGGKMIAKGEEAARELRRVRVRDKQAAQVPDEEIDALRCSRALMSEWRSTTQLQAARERAI